MLIWANKKEITPGVITQLAKIYREKLNTPNLKEILKAWELSTILRQIRRHFGYKKSISVLDFGTGVSPFPAYLNHIGYKDVTCLDKVKGWHRSIDELAYNEKYGSSVTYIKRDRIRRSLGTFDVIFSASVLEHIEGEQERIDVLASLARRLAPGGLFIHVVDYKEVDGMPVNLKNLKKLVDNCGVPISYLPGQTPGCRQFTDAPKYTWWTTHGRATRMTRIAFFNEKAK